MEPKIEKARKILDQGGIIGLPTETVYGLAGRIDNPNAIEKIFITKERPFFDPLIVHVSSIEQAKSLTTDWSEVADVLAEKFWPGPLTLILPKVSGINSMISAGLDTVGLRMPNHSLALEMIKKVGVPLAAPSANKFGKTSPTTAAHVRDEFKSENIFVLDGGPCNIGIESTVLLLKRTQESKIQLSILRPGHILQSEIEKVLRDENLSGEFVVAVDKKDSPGHMKHHYMPPVPLILCQDLQRSPESLLIEVNEKISALPEEIDSVKIVKPQDGIRTYHRLDLSPDPILATREFYGKLREVAGLKPDCIILYRTPQQFGERWASLFERAQKAASLII